MSRERTIFWKRNMGVSGLLVALAVLIVFMTVAATRTLTAAYAVTAVAVFCGIGMLSPFKLIKW